MPNKTGRKELSSETIAVILALHKLGYTASQISREEGLTKDIPKSTITFQIRRAKRHQNDPCHHRLAKAQIRVASAASLVGK
jgi:hypothetical protein